MLKKLTVYNFQPNQSPSDIPDGVLVLATCQRKLWISIEPLPFVTEFYAEVFQGAKAYAFLLEVLCGLRSKLVAETEIIRQFKKCYADYGQANCRCGQLMKVVERVLKDAKEIRHLHLRQVSGRSYASLCRKIVTKEKQISRALIVGSGDLARDLVRFFQDSTPLAITARNHQAVCELRNEFQLSQEEWKDYAAWTNYQCIINTVGIEDSLFDQGFFESWKARHASEKVFVDLGSPSPLRTTYSAQEGVYRLHDILKLADESSEQNDRYIQEAYAAIHQRSILRSQYFDLKKKSSCCQQKGVLCAHL